MSKKDTMQTQTNTTSTTALRSKGFALRNPKTFGNPKGMPTTTMSPPDADKNNRQNTDGLS
jgi:hypothetical protein